MKIDAIYSYDNHSESIKRVAETMGLKLISHENSKFIGGNDKIVLNWGCSDLPRQVRMCQIVNDENPVRLACNKLFTFRTLSLHKEIRLPNWTTDIEVAKKYKGKVYCRTKLTGHDGAGIVLASKAGEVVPAKLYTEQIAPPGDCKEYRINVFRDTVLSRQKKVRVQGKKKYNDEVKTTDGGYGFDLVEEVPLGIIPMAKLAVKQLGLDFGGVDVVFYDKKAYILEVNTAPQLTPFTAERFCKALKDNEK